MNLRKPLQLVLLALLALTHHGTAHDASAQQQRTQSREAGPREAGPEEIVRRAYALVARGLSPNAQGDLVPWRPPHRGALFTKRLARMFAADDRYMEESGDMGHLGHDPFLSGQDGEVKSLRLRTGAREGDAAQVEASFRSFGQPVRVRFVMTREEGAWRIADIFNGEGADEISIVKMLSEPYPCGSTTGKPCPKP